MSLVTFLSFSIITPFRSVVLCVDFETPPSGAGTPDCVVVREYVSVSARPAPEISVRAAAADNIVFNIAAFSMICAANQPAHRAIRKIAATPDRFLTGPKGRSLSVGLDQ